jgi:hypothetical protein
MTDEELQALIANTIKETMQEIVEDILALNNESYLSSIEQARADYQAGRVITFKDAFDV